MIFNYMKGLLPFNAVALLLLACFPRLHAQDARDSGRSLAMAPPLPPSYSLRFGIGEPFQHLGLQLQAGVARLSDYPYTLGSGFATVIEDHLAPSTFTAMAFLYVAPFEIPIGIGLGYQHASLRSEVDYAGVPIHRFIEGDTITGTVLFNAHNSAQSIILDLSIDLVRLELGSGELYLRSGLRNRASFRQELTETIAIPGSVGDTRLPFGDRYPVFANGSGAVIFSSDISRFTVDVAVSVGIGWRIGFPGWYDNVLGGYPIHGPILIIPTIDFYMPVIGSRPIEQASWEVMVGAGFVVPL